MGLIRCPTDSPTGIACSRLDGHEGEHLFAFGEQPSPTTGTDTWWRRFSEPDHVRPRGFHGYAEVPTRDGDTISVQESSLAGEGAHVRIYSGHLSMFPSNGNARERVPEHYRNCLHLNVRQALQLTSALLRWVDDAMAGRLTEPAQVEEEIETSPALAAPPCSMFMGTGERCVLPVDHDGFHSAMPAQLCGAIHDLGNGRRLACTLPDQHGDGEHHYRGGSYFPTSWPVRPLCGERAPHDVPKIAGLICWVERGHDGAHQSGVGLSSYCWLDRADG